MRSNKSKAKIDFRITISGLLSADVPTGGTSDYGPEMLRCAGKSFMFCRS
jgi:hypothetical protein